MTKEIDNTFVVPIVFKNKPFIERIGLEQPFVGDVFLYIDKYKDHYVVRLRLRGKQL